MGIQNLKDVLDKQITPTILGADAQSQQAAKDAANAQATAQANTGAVTTPIIDPMGGIKSHGDKVTYDIFKTIYGQNVADTLASKAASWGGSLSKLAQNPQDMVAVFGDKGANPLTGALPFLNTIGQFAKGYHDAVGTATMTPEQQKTTAEGMKTALEADAIGQPKGMESKDVVSTYIANTKDYRETLDFYNKAVKSAEKTDPSPVDDKNIYIAWLKSTYPAMRIADENGNLMEANVQGLENGGVLIDTFNKISKGSWALHPEERNYYMDATAQNVQGVAENEKTWRDWASNQGLSEKQLPVMNYTQFKAPEYVTGDKEKLKLADTILADKEAQPDDIAWAKKVKGIK